jgi:predicted ATP-dependent protease
MIGIAREGVYRALYTADPDFRELFKVKANFDMRIDRTPENEEDYAGLLASVTQREGLPPVDRGGVARVVEEGMRMAEDHNKLSILFGEIADIVREAAYWARQGASPVITEQHISRAIAARYERVNLIEHNVREAIRKEIVVVDTTGVAVGQVNGLSVIDLGDTAFGQPSRITATVGVGREGVVDLQREALMSGPIHSKAVLTLTGFLVDRYAAEAPLTLSARLAFEQSYGLLEGDSATCAETCALLSKLSGVPIRQSLAITGSMDQRGDIQAIGGANHKIEGFYDVCNERGLTGEQGVVIPASNIQHLMLREDVVEAVRAGRFKVYSVSTVDDALELLTGAPAGERGPDGAYPPDSINGLVQAQLTRFAERLRAFTSEHWRELLEPGQ